MNLFDKKHTAHHLAYTSIRDSDHPMDISGKELCEKLWECFEPYADSNFVEEFGVDFYARFWEMDLTCVFLEHEYDLCCPKPGPDICLSSESGKIWVEAIAPTSGQGDDKVPDIRSIDQPVPNIAQSVPDEEIILRYTASIAEKHKKYLGYLEKGIVTKNEPYIIAINGCQISRSDHEPSRIIRAVFPIGDEYVTFNGGAGEIVGGGCLFKPSVTKVSGTEIPINIFLNPKFSGVSAVLFSNTDCCNRPESTGDDYLLVYNPLASNVISEGFVKFGRECIAEPSGEEEYSLRWNDYRSSYLTLERLD